MGYSTKFGSIHNTEPEAVVAEKREEQEDFARMFAGLYTDREKNKPLWYKMYEM